MNSTSSTASSIGTDLSALLNNKKMVSKYQNIHKLGSGASGTVFSAFRSTDKRKVAIKLILRSTFPLNRLVKDKDPLGRPLAIPLEVYILRRLSHPGIVKLVDFHQDEYHFYIITEFHGSSWSSGLNAGHDNEKSSCDEYGAVDLFECIEYHKQMDETLALHIIKQLVDVLVYLKSMHVFHLDIKDENIVIDKNYTVKLVDFGSAEIVNKPSSCTYQPSPPPPQQHNVSSSWLMKTFRGTLSYAPPEVLLGHQYDPETSDIWSVGVVLFTLLYGQNPYSTPANTLEGRLTPLRNPKHKISISNKTCALLQAMLKRNPFDRADFQTVLAVLESIQREIPAALALSDSH